MPHCSEEGFNAVGDNTTQGDPASTSFMALTTSVFPVMQFVTIPHKDSGTLGDLCTLYEVLF
jgi:hypothetical protein